MFDRNATAQPATAITMVGDVPIPLPDAPPTVGPLPLPSPPIPHIGNPVPYVVHGAEAAWSDVSGWVSDYWHGLTGFFSGGFSMGWDEVKGLVDIALTAEQTAWASFISTLESWINAGNDALAQAIQDTAVFTTGLAIDVWEELQADVSHLGGLIYGAVYGIDQAIAQQWWDTVAAIDGAEADIQAWAIDNIYSPLLTEILHGIGALRAELDAEIRAIDGELSHLHLGEIPGILAKLGAVAAVVAAVESWVNDCGEPMCEQVGPKTDFSKLLKVLNVAGMLALITSLGALTEAQLEQLAATVASIGADPAGAFVNAFVTDGDTLATAVADTIPQIAL